MIQPGTISDMENFKTQRLGGQGSQQTSGETGTATTGRRRTVRRKRGTSGATVRRPVRAKGAHDVRHPAAASSSESTAHRDSWHGPEDEHPKGVLGATQSTKTTVVTYETKLAASFEEHQSPARVPVGPAQTPTNEAGSASGTMPLSPQQTTVTLGTPKGDPMARALARCKSPERRGPRTPRTIEPAPSGERIGENARAEQVPKAPHRDAFYEKGAASVAHEHSETSVPAEAPSTTDLSTQSTISVVSQAEGPKKRVRKKQRHGQEPKNGRMSASRQKHAHASTDGGAPEAATSSLLSRTALTVSPSRGKTEHAAESIKKETAIRGATASKVQEDNRRSAFASSDKVWQEEKDSAERRPTRLGHVSKKSVATGANAPIADTKSVSPPLHQLSATDKERFHAPETGFASTTSRRESQTASELQKHQMSVKDAHASSERNEPSRKKRAAALLQPAALETDAQSGTKHSSPYRTAASAPTIETRQKTKRPVDSKPALEPAMPLKRPASEPAGVDKDPRHHRSAEATVAQLPAERRGTRRVPAKRDATTEAQPAPPSLDHDAAERLGDIRFNDQWNLFFDHDKGRFYPVHFAIHPNAADAAAMHAEIENNATLQQELRELVFTICRLPVLPPRCILTPSMLVEIVLEDRADLRGLLAGKYALWRGDVPVLPDKFWYTFLIQKLL